MKRMTDRLFAEDGKLLLVALDHALFRTQPLPGLIHPGETIRKVVAGGADTVMTSLGTCIHFREELAGCGLILSAPNRSPSLECTVEAARAVGADAVKCMIYPGWPEETSLVNEACWLGAECLRRQMPLLIEPIPGGWEAGPEFRTPEIIAGGARVAAECGADIVKTFYTGSLNSFKMVVENCYLPVIILGGSKVESDEDLLEMVKGSIDAGGKGVAIGRNIFGHPNPEKIVAAMAAIIHDDASVARAMRKLR